MLLRDYEEEPFGADDCHRLREIIALALQLGAEADVVFGGEIAVDERDFGDGAKASAEGDQAGKRLAMVIWPAALAWPIDADRDRHRPFLISEDLFNTGTDAGAGRIAAPNVLCHRFTAGLISMDV